MKLLNIINEFTKKNSNALCVGAGVVCLISGYILACKAGAKANSILTQHTRCQTKKYNAHYVMSTKEKMALTWKVFMPSSILVGLGISAFIFANKTNLKQKAALSSAYILSEKKLKEYQNTLYEQLGPKKKEAIVDKVNESIITNVDSTKVPLVVSNGDHLCYDAYADRYFKSNIEIVKRAINEANSKLLDEGTLDLNDYYDLLKLDHMPIAEGMGWEAYDKKLIEVRYSSHLTKDGVPCLAIDYYNRPILLRGGY